MRCNSIIPQYFPASANPTLRRQILNPHLRKILGGFAVSGLLCGGIFSYVIDIDSLEKFWFSRLDISFLANWKFFFFAGLLFQVSIWASYGLSVARGWLKVETDRPILRRWGAGLFIQVVFLAISFPKDIDFRVFLTLFHPVILSLALTIALWIIHKKWVADILGHGILFGYCWLITILLISHIVKVELFYAGMGAFYAAYFGYGMIKATDHHWESNIAR
jgi:hypothetical protein